MASMRDIQQRIKSVGNTQQITKAMNLVAASKLQRARARLASTRPFFTETRKVIGSIVENSKGVKHKFLNAREVKNSVIIVINGDRGLCGGYNANICKAAMDFMKTKDTPVGMVTVGNKARDFFRRRGVNIIRTYGGISAQPFYSDAAEIGKLVTGMYESGEVDEVYLAYTEFKTTITHEPKVIRILPINTDEFADKKAEGTPLKSMIYEPDEEAVLDVVIPKYISTVIYGALVEASACEQGARMTAMDSATENAGEMIESLTLLYNRARQGAITQEITEIVGGANALE